MIFLVIVMSMRTCSIIVIQFHQCIGVGAGSYSRDIAPPTLKIGGGGGWLKYLLAFPAYFLADQRIF